MGLIYNLIIYPIIYIFPAYAANGAPILFGGGAPLDFKKKFMGKRIFGDHKTIRGTAAALIIGIIAGALEGLAFPFMFKISILLTIGAVFGDSARQLHKKEAKLQKRQELPDNGPVRIRGFCHYLRIWYGQSADLVWDSFHIVTNWNNASFN